VLELDHVTVKAGAFSLQAHFALSAGQRFAVIGASGTGKSTLLDVISGFRIPQTGTVRWNGQEITHHAPADRPVSILFQDANLFPHLTIERNLALSLNPVTGRFRKGDRERIAAVLDRVGLHGFEERRLAEMSGGQQSRAALARVILQNRPILLLDEPFAALGPALKDDMLDLVIALAGRENKLVLLVTHDPKDARRFAEHTIVVEDGRAMAPQDTVALLDNPPPGLREYLGSGA